MGTAATAPGSDSATRAEGVTRRDVLAQQILLAMGLMVPQSVRAEPTQTAQMGELSDGILAYKFSYPVQTVSGKPLSMNLARVPERYSSAAPLTADARQRIVTELLDVKNFVSVSVSVGPASGILKLDTPADWKAKDVAITVLVDRSTSRISSGQRITLNNIEESHKETRDGLEYWVYEHLTQGSPTIAKRQKETYRHALAATTWRAGLDGTPYLYTLNLACPQELWDDLQPLFKQAVDDFRLTATTSDYVPPDKDPWRFF